MSKCKNGKCSMDNPDTSIVKELKQGEHKYSFPKYGITIIAKSLSEAEEKLKTLTSYQNKSI